VRQLADGAKHYAVRDASHGVFWQSDDWQSNHAWHTNAAICNANVAIFDAKSDLADAAPDIERESPDTEHAPTADAAEHNSAVKFTERNHSWSAAWHGAVHDADLAEQSERSTLRGLCRQSGAAGVFRQCIEPQPNKSELKHAGQHSEQQFTQQFREHHAVPSGNHPERCCSASPTLRSRESA
jgi:hypothetical protein